MALPAELCCRIVDYNRLDRHFLLDCSLTNTIFRDICQQHIFATPIFSIHVDCNNPEAGCPSTSHWKFLDPTHRTLERLTPAERDKSAYSALDTLQNALTGRNGSRLQLYVQSLSVTLQPQYFESAEPSFTNPTWGSDVLLPIRSLLQNLPSLNSLRLSNMLPPFQLNPWFPVPNLEGVLSSIASNEVDILDIRRFTGAIPSRVFRGVRELKLREADVLPPDNFDDPRRGFPDRGGTGSVSPLPGFQVFKYHSPSDRGHGTANQIFDRCRSLRSFRVLLSSDSCDIIDPVPELQNLVISDSILCLGFDIDILSTNTQAMVERRINDLVYCSQLEQFDIKSVNEFEIKFRLQHPKSSLDFEGDFTQLGSSWRQLKEVICIKFGGRISTFRLHLQVYVGEDSEKSSHRLKGDRLVTKGFLETLFESLTFLYCINVEVVYDLIYDFLH